MQEINHTLESAASIVQQSALGSQEIARASEAATRAAEAINHASQVMVDGTNKLQALAAEFKV